MQQILQVSKIMCVEEKLTNTKDTICLGSHNISQKPLHFCWELLDSVQGIPAEKTQFHSICRSTRALDMGRIPPET